ncbi:MAG: hypothetical protein IT200_14365 [Thermoleophilia bacterium]|nr:hypothetical protein [Thermoleophilia bacterium]
MEPKSVFGLPAHPFLVHVPVVLIPLTALVALVVVFLPRHRRPLSLMVAGLAIVSAIGAILAAGSGEALEEALEERNPLVHDHAELGEGTRTFAILFAIAAIAFAIHHWPDRLRLGPGSGPGRLVRHRRVFAVTAAAMLLTAGLATAWTIRTGHSGAKAVWQEEWDKRDQAGGEAGQRDESRAMVLPATASAPGTRR